MGRRRRREEEGGGGRRREEEGGGPHAGLKLRRPTSVLPTPLKSRWSRRSSQAGAARRAGASHTGGALASNRASARCRNASYSHTGSGERRNVPPQRLNCHTPVLVVRTRASTKHSLAPSLRTKHKCVPEGSSTPAESSTHRPCIPRRRVTSSRVSPQAADVAGKKSACFARSLGEAHRK